MQRPIRLKDYEREIIRQAGTLEYYHPGESIFCIGDPADRVYLIESGRVKLLKMPEINQFLDVGELLGVAEVVHGINRTRHAIAVTEVQLVVIGQEALGELLVSEPFLTIKISKLLAQRMQDSETGTQGIIERWVLVRLAHLLLKLSENHYRYSREKATCIVCFSPADLAAIIGTTEQTVQLALSVMGKGLCLEIQGENIIIKDREQLARYVI